MWLRIDLQSGQSKFVETNLSFAELEQSVKENKLVKIERSLVLIPHKGEGDKQGLAAFQLKDINPSYLLCNEEFLAISSMGSFGVVDECCDLWRQIAEQALGEKQIIAPKKKILLR